MPRGVPASGRRQPRAVEASELEAETPVAFEAEDVADREPVPADEEATAPGGPTFSVIDTSPPDYELTPEQQEIKRLRDQLARETGRKDVGVQVQELAKPGDGKNILIHILEDGTTMLGKVWYRGDELEFEPGSRAYKDTFNRYGQSWLDLRLDEFKQAERWGKILFRNGPWPGKSYADGTFETLRSESGEGMIPTPSQAEIDAAEKLRKKRAAPHLPAGI
jgi:hypothetical protein